MGAPFGEQPGAKLFQLTGGGPKRSGLFAGPALGSACQEAGRPSGSCESRSCESTDALQGGFGLFAAGACGGEIDHIGRLPALHDRTAFLRDCRRSASRVMVVSFLVRARSIAAVPFARRRRSLLAPHARRPHGAMNRQALRLRFLASSESSADVSSFTTAPARDTRRPVLRASSTAYSSTRASNSEGSRKLLVGVLPMLRM